MWLYKFFIIIVHFNYEHYIMNIIVSVYVMLVHKAKLFGK